MGSVNANTASRLPQAAPPSDTTPDAGSAGTGGNSSGGFINGLYSIGTSLGSVAQDLGVGTGIVSKEDDGSIGMPPNPVATVGLAGVTVGPTALVAMVRNKIDPLTGVDLDYSTRFGSTAAAAGLKLTPTLVSAILGPAIADGATMLLPNLVPKYKDASKMPTAKAEDKEAKAAQEKANKSAKVARMVAGGALVGVAAAVVFLIKPDVFKKFGSGLADAQAAGKSSTYFINSEAIEGVTHFVDAAGNAGKIAGIYSSDELAGVLRSVGRANGLTHFVNDAGEAAKAAGLYATGELSGAKALRGFTNAGKLEPGAVVDGFKQGRRFLTSDSAPIRALGKIPFIGDRVAASTNHLARFESVGGYTITKQVAGMSRDAVFSNRFIAATVGAVGTAVLADKAVGAEGEDANKWWIAAGIAGAATIGATYGVGRVTEKAIQSEVGQTVYRVANGKEQVIRGVLDANGVRQALRPTRDAITVESAVDIVKTVAGDGVKRTLAKNQIMYKPNLTWIKNFGGKIAPVTAIPAGTAASQYFNIFNDIDDITAAKSPFRK